MGTVSILCAYMEFRKKNEFNIDEFRECLKYIDRVLRIWHDRQVGIKESDAKMAVWQEFYCEFRDLLSFLNSNRDILATEELEFLNHAVYVGDIYRYIGTRSGSGKYGVKPNFNDTYVSWSTKKESHYMESKLRGVMTRLSCTISEPCFGISIVGCSVCIEKFLGKTNLYMADTECEVVYPTLQDSVYCVEYFKASRRGGYKPVDPETGLFIK